MPSKAGLIYEAIGLVGDQHLCVSSTWPIGDRLARARRPNRAPRPSAGAELTLGWRHGSSARVDRRDDRDVAEEREGAEIWTPENTQLTTATSVTNGLNTLLEYVGSVGKYSCRGGLRGLDERLTGFGIRELRGAQGRAVISRSVIPVPAAASSTVGRGSKADPAGPAFGKKHQSLVITVFFVPCRRSCRRRP